MNSSQGSGATVITGPNDGPLLNVARQLPTAILERVLQERYEEAAGEWQEEDFAKAYSAGYDHPSQMYLGPPL